MDIQALIWITIWAISMITVVVATHYHMTRFAAFADVISTMAQRQALSALTTNGYQSSSSSTESAGAGISSSGVSIPNWNQLDDPLPDGAQDPFSTSDCGEECVAECVFGARGVTVSAGDVRFALGGSSRPGWTTSADLIQAFDYYGMRSKALAMSAGDLWKATSSSVSSGQPVILLGNWLGPGPLHWIVAVRTAGLVLVCNDPWGGQTKLLVYSDFSRNASGQAVIVQETMSHHK